MRYFFLLFWLLLAGFNFLVGNIFFSIGVIAIAGMYYSITAMFVGIGLLFFWVFSRYPFRSPLS